MGTNGCKDEATKVLSSWMLGRLLLVAVAVVVVDERRSLPIGSLAKRWSDAAGGIGAGKSNLECGLWASGSSPVSLFLLLVLLLLPVLSLSVVSSSVTKDLQLR